MPGAALGLPAHGDSLFDGGLLLRVQLVEDVGQGGREAQFGRVAVGARFRAAADSGQQVGRGQYGQHDPPGGEHRGGSAVPRTRITSTAPRQEKRATAFTATAAIFRKTIQANGDRWSRGPGIP
ncbi:hypothetical protein [Streptomyces sp. RPT161]|uniref:hypothetical protein n=1 Tax=Streptomyces sp. RPT161 TaxID=3015993 RepID=UPI0022B8C651|nr:hypothetical protein [Streptomyces sp. RPT161]